MKKIISIAIMALSLNSIAQIPTIGLVGHYSFTGNANDQSGNSNIGIMSNGAAFTTDRFGLPNCAASFDGVNDYVSLPSGSATSLNILGDFTVSFWIKTTDNSGMIVSTGDNITGPPSGSGYLSGINGGNVGSGKLGVATRGIWNGSDSAVNDDYWHHITYILKSDTLRIYIDNVLDNETTSIQSPLSWSGSRVIGCRHDTVMSAVSNFAGSIDDLRIYNLALTPSNVNSLFYEYICIETVYDTLIVYDTTNVTVIDTNYITITDTNYVTITDTNYVTITDTNYVTITDTNYVTVTDTNYVTITDTAFISVTDTLFIDLPLSVINPPNNINTIKIYPNPSSSYIYIDNGNYSLMNNYSIRIVNSLNNTVFNSLINQQQFYIDLFSWSGNGIYLVKIIDNLGNIIDVRKIILY